MSPVAGEGLSRVRGEENRTLSDCVSSSCGRDPVIALITAQLFSALDLVEPNYRVFEIMAYFGYLFTVLTGRDSRASDFLVYAIDLHMYT